MINQIYPATGKVPFMAATSPSIEKSLDTLAAEKAENLEPLDMKEFGFMLLYNEWMQNTLLSDGLTEESQGEW